jgi:hypothetical protein
MTRFAALRSPFAPMRRAARAVVLVCALVCSPGRLRAQPSAAPAALVTEVQQLRTELDRVNRDVEALKRGERGLRDDARLRQRLADAEAIARKLTDAERRLAAYGTSGGDGVRTAGPLPNAQPGDGPAELAAKADILTDQSQRLAREADRMARAADSVRGRELLRRRAGQLDRDPFAGFEAPKRLLAFSSTPRSLGGSGPATTPSPSGGRGTTTPTESTKTGSDSAAASGGPPPPMAPAGAVAAPGAGSNGPGSSPAPTSQTPSSPTPAGPSAPSGSGSTGDATVPSLAFRTLLDPTTIAELRRIEAQGTAAARAEAFARAAAALRARAAALETEAAALRRLAKQR